MAEPDPRSIGIPTPERRHHAFISYSRNDRAKVELLHDHLKRIVRRWWWQDDALDIFRDLEDLEAGGELSERIERALDDSRNLILAVSESSAASPYVAEEVMHWYRANRFENVIFVIADWGRPEAPLVWDRRMLPEPVRHARVTNPNWVDIRRLGPLPRPGRRLADGDLDGVASIVAAIDPDRTKQGLIGEVRRRRRRNSAIAVTLALLLVVAAGAAGLATRSSRLSAANHRSVELATAAMNEREPEIAFLLAGESFQVAPTPESISALGHLLAEGPGVVAQIDLDDQPLLAAGPSAAGDELLLVAADGRLTSLDLADLTTSVRQLDTGLGAADFGQEVVVVATTDRVQVRPLSDPATVVADVELTTRQLAVADDGTTAIGTEDGRLLRLANGGHSVEEIANHDGPVADVAITPDGSRVASVGDDGVALVVDVASGRVRSFESIVAARERALVAVALSDDGARLAAAGLDRRVNIWDVSTGRQTSVALEAELSRVESMAFSPGGQFLVAGGGRGEVAALDVVRSETIEWRGLAHDGVVTDVAPVPGSSLFASTGFSGQVVFWDTAGRISYAHDVDGTAGFDHDAVTDEIVTITPGGVVTVLDGAGAIRWEWSGSQPATDVSFGADSTVLVGLADGDYVQLDRGSGTETARAAVPGGGFVLDVMVDAAAPAAFVLGFGGAVVGFDPRTLETTWETTVDLPGANRLMATPEGELLVFGNDTPWVQALSMVSGEPVDSDVAGPVAFAARADTVAYAGDREGAVVVEGDNVLNGRLTLFVPDATFDYLVALAPDGSLIAVLTADGAVSVWDAGSGRQLLPFRSVHLPFATRDLRFLDDHRLVSVGVFSIVSWDLDPDRWMAAACARMTRSPTTDELDRNELTMAAGAWCTSGEPRSLADWDQAARLTEATFETLAMARWNDEFDVADILVGLDDVHLEAIDALTAPEAERIDTCSRLAVAPRLERAGSAFIAAPSRMVAEMGDDLVETLRAMTDTCVELDLETFGSLSSSYLRQSTTLFTELWTRDIIGP